MRGFYVYNHDYMFDIIAAISNCVAAIALYNFLRKQINRNTFIVFIVYAAIMSALGISLAVWYRPFEQYSPLHLESPFCSLLTQDLLEFIENSPNLHMHPSHINPDLDSRVFMSITEITSSTITVTIQNESELLIYAEDSFQLNIYCDIYEGWIFVPPPPVGRSNGPLLNLPIPPNESLEIIIYLQDILYLRNLHILEPGLYRIIYFVFLPELIDYSDDRAFHAIAAEFYWHYYVKPTF